MLSVRPMADQTLYRHHTTRRIEVRVFDSRIRRNYRAARQGLLAPGEQSISSAMKRSIYGNSDSHCRREHLGDEVRLGSMRRVGIALLPIP